MRVLMIAPTSFFSDYGGHIRILEEMRALQAKGIELAIVTYYKGNDVPGIDVRRTAPLPWRTDYEVGSSRHKIAFDVYLAAQSMAEGLRFHPDVVHGHMHEGALIGGVLARVLRVPLVFDFQGSLTAEMVDHRFLNPDGPVYPLAFRVESFITRRLPAAILTSSGQASALLRERFEVPHDRIVPLPDCADPTRFDPSAFPADRREHPLRAQLGIADVEQVVGYLGLLTDYQGIPTILHTAAAARERGESVHFLVMGYPNVEQYQAQAHAMGLAGWVTFTGRVPFENAPYYLAACDIALAPKLSTTEGSGKLLNYMAMAQPIVAYDTPVNREYLGELGVYAPAGDREAYAAAVLALLQDHAKGATLGAALRARAIERFSWPAAAEVIASLYERLTEKPRRHIL